MRATLLAIGVVFLAACAASGPRRSGVSAADLLSGETLGPSFVASAAPVIAIENARALDDDMRTFARGVNKISDESTHAGELLDAMKRHGLFALDYNDTSTHTVSETFHERRGNCLSFTMLFVELARAVGLRAHYQLVDVPPRWSHETDLIVIANHVNTIIESRFGK